MDKDFIERPKLVTRTATLVVVYSFAQLDHETKDMLVEYTTWAMVVMFAALLFGDKMLVQVKDIVKAWRGN